MVRSSFLILGSLVCAPMLGAWLLRGGDAVAPGLGAGIVCALYLLPTCVAYDHRHRQRQAIATLNVFAGWTALGWVAALVWAMTRPQPHA
jgi:Superinfection immunity protein